MNATLRNRRVWVAGHTGLVGSAVMRRLGAEGCELLCVAHGELDLRDQQATAAWIEHARPDMIVLAAATVGGIGANASRPADFLYDNLMISANVIHAAALCGTEKLLFLGSSCIYPRHAVQPIVPESLLSGPLEPTNAAYAVAKIAGITLCQSYRTQHGCDFISAMPCNLYGPGDCFDPVRSHVIPAMMVKFHRAKLENVPSVTLWGTGEPLREFLHADDLADGLVMLLRDHSGPDPVNIGSGEEWHIRDLAALMAEITDYAGTILFDSSMPDGVPRKVLDSGVIRGMGWSPSVALRDGLESTYRWYCDTGGIRAAG